ncbi:MAG: ammonia-forming cytochrome c nitrite reductase subunit c552 [Phaeodactylibacter sp.]|nr:ammonia-forming cytochrome c nitrite reductase subunit c552 [Phaeodactylibacter sp.]MCB9274999.1 ammonia-forming cytochrome c nitrite reductase subunit c552 [Lewinellaceae bacterium]
MRVRIFFATLLSLALALSFSACEGDQGPQGPEGPTGATGPEGPAGQNGAENCLDCHGNSQLITAKLFQWENSFHALGGHYDRNTNTCAGCHTSQGFRERIASGEMNTMATIDDPLPINCYTCHNIHQTYSTADWGLTATEPVTFWVGGKTSDLGEGNLCINCHQARVPSPALPEPGATDIVNLTNKRYGPHHGAQGVLFSGAGAYEVPGPTPYTNSVHTSLVENSCISCHMATVASGRSSGGHTFRVESETGSLNTAGCAQCHTDNTELLAKVEETQATIDDLLLQLGTRMNELGLLDDALEYAVTPKDFTSEQLGILWNYQYVKEDKSLGVHNFKYAKALLENSIAALN